MEFNRIICLHSVLPSGYSIKKLGKLLKTLGFLGVKIIPLMTMLKEKPRGKNIALTFDDGYADNFRVLLPFLVDKNLHATLFFGPELFLSSSSLSDRISMGLKPLELGNSSDIAKWLAAGMGVGYHTKNHQDLFRLKHKFIERDFKEGVQMFRNICGFTPQVFAYPFGNLPQDFNSFKTLAQSYSFEFCLTVNWGDIADSKGDYLIKRVCLGDNDPILWSVAKAIGIVDFYYNRRKLRTSQTVVIDSIPVY